MKPATARLVCVVGSRKMFLYFLPIAILAGISLLRFLPARADSPTNQATAPGVIRSFPLRFSEASAMSTRLILGQQEVRFRKEPKLNRDDKIVRQAIRIGPQADDYIGFLVNLTSRMLYLDLNGNLDLTDDPEGVYRSATIGPARSLICSFRSVRLVLHNGGVERSYVLEPFTLLNERTNSIGIRSCYEGEVEIGGRTWLLQVQDNLDGRFDAHDKFILTQLSLSSGPRAIFYAAMPLTQDLFAGGREYRMKVAFTTGTGSPATVMFEELHPAMSELALEGQFIRRLVLSQGNAGLVLFDHPEQKIKLPAGDYSILNAYLQKEPGKPVLVASAGTSHFTATAGTTTRLRVGAPFVSTVAVERKGNSLQMRYILRGAAKEEYTFNNPDKNNPPKFVIYLGDKVVASDSFEFG